MYQGKRVRSFENKQDLRRASDVGADPASQKPKAKTQLDVGFLAFNKLSEQVSRFCSGPGKTLTGTASQERGDDRPLARLVVLLKCPNRWSGQYDAESVCAGQRPL